MGKCLSTYRVTPEKPKEVIPVTKFNNYFPKNNEVSEKEEVIRGGEFVSSRKVLRTKKLRRQGTALPKNRIYPVSNKFKKKKRSLISAIKFGDDSRISEIIRDKDLNVLNERGMWGSTPLICACQYVREETAMQLIERGVDVNALNEKGCSALLHASLEGLDKVVRILVEEKSANIKLPAAMVYNKRNDSNEKLTPLCAASANGHIHIIAMLMKATKFEDEQILEAIYQASGNGRNEVLKTLLDISNIQPRRDKIPLDVICSKGYTETLSTLISHGFEVKCCYSGLKHASSEDHIDLLTLLINSGLDLQCPAASEHLIECCRTGSKECVQALLQARINLDAIDKNTGLTLKELVVNIYGQELLREYS